MLTGRQFVPTGLPTHTYRTLGPYLQDSWPMPTGLPVRAYRTPGPCLQDSQPIPTGVPAVPTGLPGRAYRTPGWEPLITRGSGLNCRTGGQAFLTGLPTGARPFRQVRRIPSGRFIAFPAGSSGSFRQVYRLSGRFVGFLPAGLPPFRQMTLENVGSFSPLPMGITGKTQN